MQTFAVHFNAFWAQLGSRTHGQGIYGTKPCPALTLAVAAVSHYSILGFTDVSIGGACSYTVVFWCLYKWQVSEVWNPKNGVKLPTMINPVTGTQSQCWHLVELVGESKPNHTSSRLANINDAVMEEIMDRLRYLPMLVLNKDEDDDADLNDHCAHLPLGKWSNSSLTGIKGDPRLSLIHQLQCSPPHLCLQSTLWSSVDWSTMGGGALKLVG